MIEKLTAEQEEMLKTYRDKWLKIGLSTSSNLDQDKIKKVIPMIYENGGLNPPINYIFLDSPYQVKNTPFKMSQVKNQVWDELGLRVIEQVWGKVSENISDRVFIQVEKKIREKIQVCDHIRDEVLDGILEDIGAQVWGQVGVQVWEGLWDKLGYACHDADWLATFDYYRYLGVHECDRLRPIMDLADLCGWWWPFKDTVIITPKPLSLHLDENGNLHAVGKKAVEYPDSWGLWRVHGVDIPEKWASKPAHEWQEKWLLETNDEDEKRVIKKVLNNMGSTGFSHK